MLNENDPDNQDNELVSKSQLKRDSHDVQKFGKQLVALRPAQLDELDLPDNLYVSITTAQKILNKRSALKRQYQYIGKILRNIDIELILVRYDRIKNQAEINNKLQQQAEYWRDKIVLNGNDTIDSFIDSIQVDCDRQQLRQLARNAKSAKKDSQKTTYARQIFKVIYQALKQQDENDNA